MCKGSGFGNDLPSLTPRNSDCRSTQFAINAGFCISGPFGRVTINYDRLFVAYDPFSLRVAVLVFFRPANISKPNLCKQNVLIALTALKLTGKGAAIPNHLDVDELMHVEPHGFAKCCGRQPQLEILKETHRRLFQRVTSYRSYSDGCRSW